MENVKKYVMKTKYFVFKTYSWKILRNESFKIAPFQHDRIRGCNNACVRCKKESVIWQLACCSLTANFLAAETKEIAREGSEPVASPRDNTFHCAVRSSALASLIPLFVFVSHAKTACNDFTHRAEKTFFRFRPASQRDLLLLLCQSSRSFPTFRSSLPARGKHDGPFFLCRILN